MNNIYWPVYKNLEDAVDKLTFDIHIDDNQLDVYSSRISDLILRAAIEIESISKDLYSMNGGEKKDHLKYDDDAIKLLNRLWNLDKKVVNISSINCFQSNKSLYPFVKNEEKTFNKKLTYSWNNSYQNLKHDRANSLKFGSIKYLFDIMAALFILNLYFKEDRIELGRDSQATNFPVNMGSGIFSVKLHRWTGYDGRGIYAKKEDFDECIYLTKMTDTTYLEQQDAQKKVSQIHYDLITNHPKFKKYLENNDPKKYRGNNLAYDVLGKNDYQITLHQACTNAGVYDTKPLYEGVINKNSDIHPYSLQ